MRRDHFVIQTLKEDHRGRQTVGEMQGRALVVQVAALGIRTHEPLFVVRLEFVRIGCQRRQVADAVVAGAGLEDVSEGQDTDTAE
jgi:hypothetical protein